MTQVFADPEEFKRRVLDYYVRQARDLPWRRTRDAYAILVSEVMLQQTQVARVIPKYASFLAAFPSPGALALSSAAEVLSVWQGLGYNRRALALREAARIVEAEHGGRVPPSAPSLRRLPSIGAATAAAICVYAFDQPLVFIETNIRAAFISFFFQECSSVSDAELLPLVESTLDREDPRNWYYALMDYGSWIKKTGPNPTRKSRHHMTQPPFTGSRRQARGAVLRTLLAAGPGGATLDGLIEAPELRQREAAEVRDILSDLAGEGFLVREADRYRLA